MSTAQFVDEVPKEAREICGAENYWVTPDGRVYSCLVGQRPRMMRSAVNNLGYQKISVPMRGRRRLCSMHRLVAEAFVANPDGKPEVNHKDLDKLNNWAENLEWVTHAENLAHARANRVWRKGDRKLTGLVAFPIWPEKDQLNGGRLVKFDSYRAASVALGKKLATFSPVICRAMKKGWKAYGYWWRVA